MANTIRLTWQNTPGAVEYRVYHNISPGLSIARTPLLTTVTELTYDHVGLLPGSIHYYVIVAVGPNGEFSPPSNEVGLIASILVSITIAPLNFSIVSGNTQQYTAIGHYADLSTSDITGIAIWDTNNHGIATINSSGFLTSIASGTTNVTATLSLITGSTPVIVISLVSIAVTPTNHTMAISDTQQYTATGTYTDSSTANLTSQVTWSSTVPGFATINSSGFSTAVANGTTSIQATLGLISGSTNLIVAAPQVPVAIVVTPANYTLDLTSQQQSVATIYYEYTAPAPAWVEELDTSVTFGVTADFSTIFAFDDSHVWAGTWNGALNKVYYFNGTTWVQQTMPTPYSGVYSFYSYDGYNVLAGSVGGASPIFISSNSGTTWSSISPFSLGGSNIVSCFFIHGTVGTNLWGIFQAANASLHAAKSTNGGTTWVDMACPISGYASKLWVNHQNDVWVGDNGNGNIYHWNGSTWTTLGPLPGNQYADSLWGTDANNMFFGTYGDTGGIVHWDGYVFTSIYDGGSGDDIWNVIGRGADIWGSSFTAEEILHSTDGGASFTNHNPPGYAGQDFDFVSLGSVKLWAVSESGIVVSTIVDNDFADVTNSVTWDSSNDSIATVDSNGLVTINAVGIADITATLSGITGLAEIAGFVAPCVATWDVELSVPGGGAFIAAVFGVDANNVFAAGGNKFYKRDPGLGTWATTTITASGAPSIDVIWNGLYAPNTSVIMLVTFSHILRSADGGSTWTKIGSGGAWSIHGSSLSDIWAVGTGSGVMRHSVDGGLSFSTVSGFPTGSYSGVFAISSTDVWAAGNNGVVAHYNGTSWTKFTVGPGAGDTPTTATVDFQSVWASSASNVYFAGAQRGGVGDSPMIYKTTDTGANFTPERNFPDGTEGEITTITGFGTGFLFASEIVDTLFYSDGVNGWRQISDIPAPFNLTGEGNWGVWAAGVNNVYVVGEYGILHNTSELCPFKPLSSISITPASPPALTSGATTNLDTSILFIDSTTTEANGEVGHASMKAVWTSSDPSIASVATFPAPNPGKVTGGISSGTTIITATVSLDGDTFQATKNISNTFALSSIIVAPKDPTVAPSSTQQFVAYGVYPGGSLDVTNIVTWNSTNVSAATIVDSGTKTTVLYNSFEDGYSGWTLTGGTNTGVTTGLDGRGKVSTKSMGLSGWNSISYPGNGGQTATFTRVVAIPATGVSTLAFWYDLEDTSSGAGTAITHKAEIKDSGGTSVLQTIFNIGETYAGTNFLSKVIDLTTYAGTSIMLSFSVDAANGTSSNANANMYIDGIVIVNGAASSRGLVNTIANGTTTIQATYGVTTGSTVLTVATPPPPLLTFSSVSAPSNFWYAIWGSSTTDIYAAALDGTITRSTGGAFSNQTSGTSNALVAIWGPDSSTVYAVGDSRTVRKTINNGTTWTGLTTALPTTQDCKSIWGTTASDFWIVQEFSVQHTTDGGSSWTTYNNAGAGNLHLDTTNSIYGIFGFAANDIYICGRDSYIAHWNGTSWSTVELTISGSIYYSLWGRSGTDIYMMANTSTIYHSTNGFSSKTALTNPASFTNYQGNIFGNASYMLGGGTDHEADINLHNPAVYQEPGGYGNTLTATRLVQVSNNSNPAVFNVWIDSSTNTAYAVFQDGVGGHFIYKGV